jgi:hypothetical protein
LNREIWQQEKNLNLCKNSANVERLVIPSRSKRITIEQRLELPQKPSDIYTYTCNKPGKILAKESKKFIYVFEKFTLSKQNKILVELNEYNGERNLSLEIDAKKINRPN